MERAEGAEDGWVRESSLFRRPLRKNSLEGTAMHVKAPCCLGDVAPAQLVNSLDVLPSHPISRHRVHWGLRLAALAIEQRCHNIVGIHGLGEIVNGAELYRGNCG